MARATNGDRKEPDPLFVQFPGEKGERFRDHDDARTRARSRIEAQVSPTARDDDADVPGRELVAPERLEDDLFEVLEGIGHLEEDCAGGRVQAFHVLAQAKTFPS